MFRILSLIFADFCGFESYFFDFESCFLPYCMLMCMNLCLFPHFESYFESDFAILSLIFPVLRLVSAFCVWSKP